MPVPVPPKQPTHSVLKNYNYSNQDGQINPFHNLTCSLPAQPEGPPPSFGTREQWISSLPDWRRAKPRRIWEEDMSFCSGLAAADNVSVIKGFRAQACLPPSGEDADDEMSPVSPANSSTELRDVAMSTSATLIAYDDSEKGAFSPVLEEPSPGTHDRSSSPLEPVTPFGEFVDRAVTATVTQDPYPVTANVSQPVQDNQYVAIFDKGIYQPSAVYQPIQVSKEPVPSPAPEIVTPTATNGYKKLAEPLAEWIVNYVWKACTCNLDPPFAFSRAPWYVRPHFHFTFLF